MRASTRHVAVVGPAAPDRGGIVQHTEELVHRLAEQGASVSLHAWRRQFPRRLAPPATAAAAPDLASSDRVASRMLAWDRPDSWLRLGRSLRGNASDLVLVLSDPRQAPAMAAIAGAFRAGRGARHRTSRTRAGRVVMIVHNVLPHEPSRLARLLSPIALRVADAVIVHSSAQLMTARSLGARDAVEVVLPLHLSSPSSHVHTRSSAASGRICLVGHVRDYKGLDLLIDALGRSTARPRLEVRGVFWRPPHEFLTRARGQGVGDLVELHDGFASDQDLIDCIDRSDAVVLPYRAATGTQQPRVAFARGVPVIAADVDGLSEQVQDGEDGLLFPAGDVGALARCIDNLYRPATWERLRRGVRRPDPDREWADYLTVLLGRD